MAVACYYGIAALVLLILQFLRIAEWQTVLGNNDQYKSKQNVSSNGSLELKARPTPQVRRPLFFTPDTLDGKKLFWDWIVHFEACSQLKPWSDQDKLK
ncbi:hypothetical protein T11_3472 [Trichinella zimbabwensis]|uniref:Uncharacterized protein n=1 Tax=Trichinella zimbabwensis TaxID=268475 RepID=A0A0V1GSW8_9BILA|nr:hypothetical protein T11_3472 [Trichinella zimbabwensis]